MKTFKDLKIGDKIFWVDNNKIREAFVEGIRKPRLSDNELEITLLGGFTILKKVSPTSTVYEHSYKTYDNVFRSIRYLSCLESAELERSNGKKIYIEKQFGIALSAFRKIKKVVPKDDALKERIMKFFNYTEEDK